MPLPKAGNAKRSIGGLPDDQIAAMLGIAGPVASATGGESLVTEHGSPKTAGSGPLGALLAGGLLRQHGGLPVLATAPRYRRAAPFEKVPGSNKNCCAAKIWKLRRVFVVYSDVVEDECNFLLLRAGGKGVGGGGGGPKR